jgi:hypothetical protein
MLINLNPIKMMLPDPPNGSISIDLTSTPPLSVSRGRIINTAKRLVLNNFSTLLMQPVRRAMVSGDTETVHYWKLERGAHDIIMSHLGAGRVTILVTINATDARRCAMVTFELEENENEK